MKQILASDYSNFVESFASNTEQYFKQGATQRDIDSIYPEDLAAVLKKSNISDIWGLDGKISLLKLGLVLASVARYDCSSAALILSNYLGSAILFNDAKTPDEFAEVVRDARQFDKSIALAIFESSVGLNYKSLSTVCRAAVDEYTLRGTKRNVLGAINSEYLIVSAIEEKSGGLCFHLMESGMSGIKMQSCDSVLGLRSAGFSDITFKDTRIPDAQVMGAGQDSIELLQKLHKIICLGTAFIALGFSRAAYENSLNRSVKREQFQRAIIDFEAIQLKLSKMYTKISSLTTYLYSIAKNSLETISIKDTLSAKILATDYATEISNETIQIFGGYGYIKNDGIDRYMRDSKILQVFPISNEVLHMQVANELKSIHSKK